MKPAPVRTYFHISEITNILAEEEYGGAVFIVPSGLDKELMLRLIGGGSFFGKRPDIMTISDLYRELAREANADTLRMIDPSDRTLIIKFILDRFVKEKEEGGISLPAGVAHAGFSRVLEENIRDLLVEEVDAERLKSSLCPGGLGDESTPEAMICRLYKDYIDYLKENSLTDNAQIPALIRELIKAGGAEYAAAHKFVIVGFLMFNGGQMHLVTALREKSAGCFFILPETGLTSSHDSISQVNSDYEKRPKWNVGAVELDANNSRLEFESAAREIALWIHGESDFKKLGELGDYGDIGIMVTPQHLRLLENSLSRYKIPYNAQIRGTAGETIFGDLPRLVWNAYASGWDYRETLRFLNDPLISGGSDSCMDLGRAAALQPNSMDKWKDLLKGGALAKTLDDAEKLCRALAEPQQPKEIIGNWKSFVKNLILLAKVSDYAGDDFSFDDVVKDISSALTELDKKSKILTELTPNIGPAADVTLAGADAVRYITDWALTATLPIPLPQSHSVTIYAGQPPVLAHHKYWIMTDIDYNTWPGKLRESPLLSNEGKQRLNDSSKDAPAAETLHVPDTHDEREQKEALFRRLTAVGDDGIIIARSLTDANGRPAGRSQFTDALLSETDKERCWTSLSKVEYPLSKALPKDGEFCFAGAEVPLDGAKTERWTAARCGELPFDEKAASISMSSIDEWAACPFYYMCKNGYGLEPQSTSLFDSALAGNFVHKLWCDAWEEYKKDSTKSFVGLSEKLLEKTLREEYPALETDSRLNRRHLPRIRQQVRDVALLQDDILNALGERRISTDTEIKLPDFSIDGVKFTGRADRIDRFKDGVVIIDYKSNESKKHTKDLQLAAYAHVLEKSGDEVIGYGWIGHADSAFSGFFKDGFDSICKAYNPRSKPNTKIETMIQTAGQTMQDMANAVKNGMYPARYDAKKQCRICGYQAVCRKLELQTAEQDDDEDEESGNDQ